MPKTVLVNPPVINSLDINLNLKGRAPLTELTEVRGAESMSE